MTTTRKQKKKQPLRTFACFAFKIARCILIRRRKSKEKKDNADIEVGCDDCDDGDEDEGSYALGVVVGAAFCASAASSTRSTLQATRRLSHSLAGRVASHLHLCLFVDECAAAALNEKRRGAQRDANSAHWKMNPTQKTSCSCVLKVKRIRQRC